MWFAVLLQGQNAHPIEGEEDDEGTSAPNKRLREAKNHAWKRWRHEYVHSLMETHRITRKNATVPDVGETVLIVAAEESGKRERLYDIFEEKMELSEDYRYFTRDTTLTDRLTSCAYWK